MLEFLNNVGINRLCSGDVGRSALRIAFLQLQKPSAVESKRIFGVKSKYHLKIRDGAIVVLLFGISDGAIVEKGGNAAIQPNCFVVILDGLIVVAFESKSHLGCYTRWRSSD